MDSVLKSAFDELKKKVDPILTADPDPQDLPQDFLRTFEQKLKLCKTFLPAPPKLKEKWFSSYYLSLKQLGNIAHDIFCRVLTWRRVNGKLHWYENGQGGNRYFRGSFPYMTLRRTVEDEDGNSRELPDDYDQYATF